MEPISAILLGVFLSVGANEALRDKPCERVLIQSEQTKDGVIETRTCVE